LWGEFASTLVGTLGITRGVKDFGRAFKDYQYILGVARGASNLYYTVRLAFCQEILDKTVNDLYNVLYV